jgi:hypothetical protein
VLAMEESFQIALRRQEILARCPWKTWLECSYISYIKEVDEREETVRFNQEVYYAGAILSKSIRNFLLTRDTVK